MELNSTAFVLILIFLVINIGGGLPLNTFDPNTPDSGIRMLVNNIVWHYLNTFHEIRSIT